MSEHVAISRSSAVYKNNPHTMKSCNSRHRNTSAKRRKEKITPDLSHITFHLLMSKFISLLYIFMRANREKKRAFCLGIHIYISYLDISEEKPTHTETDKRRRKNSTGGERKSASLGENCHRLKDAADKLLICRRGKLFWTMGVSEFKTAPLLACKTTPKNSVRASRSAGILLSRWSQPACAVFRDKEQT